MLRESLVAASLSAVVVFSALSATIAKAALGTPELVTIRIPPEAARALSGLLTSGPGIFPGVTTERLRSDEIALNSESTFCLVTVLRPAMGDPPLATKGNQMTCTLAYASGPAGRLSWDLSRVPISFHGNRFQKRKPFMFEGEPAEKLHALFSAAEKSRHPFVARMPLIGGGGGGIDGIDFAKSKVNFRPSGIHEYTPLISCTRWLDLGRDEASDKVRKLYCTFEDL